MREQSIRLDRGCWLRAAAALYHSRSRRGLPVLAAAVSLLGDPIYGTPLWAQTVEPTPETMHGVNAKTANNTVAFKVDLGTSESLVVRLLGLRWNQEARANLVDSTFYDNYRNGNVDLESWYRQSDIYRIPLNEGSAIPSRLYSLFWRLPDGNEFSQAPGNFGIETSMITNTVDVNKSGPRGLFGSCASQECYDAAITRTKRATVHITVNYPGDQGQPAQGSGFVINGFGYVVTAAHVVDFPDAVIEVKFNQEAMRELDSAITNSVFVYRTVGSYFPNGYQKDVQLAIIVPEGENEEPFPFDGGFPYWLEIADFPRDGGSGKERLIFEPAGNELWAGGWPENFDQVWAVSRTPFEAWIAPPGDDMFTQSALRYHLRFKASVGPGWSGGPVTDRAGVVWAVFVWDDGPQSRYAIWAYNITSQGLASAN